MTSSAHLVAAVQFEPVPLDVRANMARAQQLAFEAAAKGAQVVVLPELCLSGRRIESPRQAADCAQARDGYQTESLLHVTRRFGCHLAFGYIESCAGVLYNSAALLGPAGVVANAQKHNLEGADHLWASRSEMPVPIVPTPMGRLGVLIGRDVMNTWRRSRPFNVAGHRFYRSGSVDVLCLLSGGSKDPHGMPDIEWVDLAEETTSNVVVAAARAGSCVIDRTLHVWTHGATDSEESVVGGMVLS